MDTSKFIIEELRQNQALLTGGHFVLTGQTRHSTDYINLRVLAHQAWWFNEISRLLAGVLEKYNPDVILGPETLGRTLATLTASWARHRLLMWCNVSDRQGGGKVAHFPTNLPFASKIAHRNVVIVDELLNSGSSISATAALARKYGGIVKAAAVPVCRTPGLTANDCGVPALEVLATVRMQPTYTAAECAAKGPCSQRVPMVLRPGHGHEWIKNHPDYPVAS